MAIKIEGIYLPVNFQMLRSAIVVSDSPAILGTLMHCTLLHIFHQFHPFDIVWSDPPNRGLTLIYKLEPMNNTLLAVDGV